MTDFLLIVLILVIGIALFLVLVRKSKIDENQTNALRDLERRMTDLVLEIKGSVDGTSQAMHQQISSFTRETVQMREQLNQLQEEVKSISSFQEIFKTPKLRGEWGEASLEHILSEYFPKELYTSNFRFSSGEIVEYVLNLPNKKLLPIDAKFFSDNFQKLIGAKSEEEKTLFEKKFLQDIKFNIDKVSSKYILPSENTVDYALMYIPAEAIFHHLMFNLREENIGEYARRKKVILTSPNTIYLTLRTIQHWFKDTQISRQTQEILRRLSRIQQDSEKLMEDFKKLGSHLKNATSSYETSERRLSLFTERVEKLTQIQEVKKIKES